MLKTSTDQRKLLPNFEHLFATTAQAPNGVARLRELILTLAVQGKLLPQEKLEGDAPTSLEQSDTADAPYRLPNGWSWVRLGAVTSNMGSGWSPACINQSRDSDAVWAVLKTTAVQINKFHSEENKVLPPNLDPRPDIEVRQGDVLITRAGPMNRVGICCYVSEPVQRLMLSDKIVRFSPDLNIFNPEFFMLCLNSGWTKSLIENSKSGMAASQVNISQKNIKDLWVPVCSLAEQSRIVARVEALMRLCDALEEKGRLEHTQHQQLLQALLDSLTQTTDARDLARHWQRLAQHFDLLIDRPEAVDALEQTILQLAVRGLLVPQDPSDEPAYKSLLSINDAKNLSDKRDIDFIFLDGDVTDLPNGWCRASVAALAYCLDYMRKPVKKDLRGGDNAKYPYYGANGQVGYIEDYIFDEDLVLVVEDETFIGRLKPFSYFISGKSWVNNHAHVLRAKEGIIPQYLNMCLERYDFVPITSGTTNRRKLTKKGLLSAQLIFPPLAEQSRIVARVTELRALCQQLRDKLTQARTTQTQLAQAWVEQVAA